MGEKIQISYTEEFQINYEASRSFILFFIIIIIYLFIFGCIGSLLLCEGFL